MIVIDAKFLAIKEINLYLVDIILINYFRSGSNLSNFEGRHKKCVSVSFFLGDSI
jgi:hypothetical protein